MITATPPFALPRLNAANKERYLHYAMQILEAQKHMLGEDGKNLLHYLLKNRERYERMTHYPQGDRIDSVSGAQYFYHCHRENFASTEHGHFHCFLRYKNIPTSIKPSALKDWDYYIENPMTHIIAIAMNQMGQPIRLFTVNRWVTSEIWYDASNMSKIIKNYQLNLTHSYWSVLDHWVEGIIHLFTPQITWLHRQRDRYMQHQIDSGNVNPYTDRSLEELSELSIDLKKQIEWVIQ
ncbi:MAG: hypothetical protein BGO90_07940 [Legionella sp. 40-6]|nr:hypothetical protein [Legionella sp.]OJY43416.1 MAG: hypothetical protein BGO90_07940 [Legionella sp. 40-6]